ncbi:MAG: trehalose-phosphatase, partial [Burkholderiaceae bacterium]
PGWDKHAENYQIMCDLWEKRLLEAFEDQTAFGHGIWIENKRYSLSIHYRLNDGHGYIIEKLENLFRQLTPAPRVISGKNIFNLLPQDAPDKGVALEKLMSSNHFRSAIYVGDDVTDEDVFRLHRPEVLTIRIENSIDSAAEFFLRQRQDIQHFLDELIVRLRLLRKAHLVPTARVANQQ